MIRPRDRKAVEPQCEAIGCGDEYDPESRRDKQLRRHDGDEVDVARTPFDNLHPNHAGCKQSNAKQRNGNPKPPRSRGGSLFGLIHASGRLVRVRRAFGNVRDLSQFE